MPPIPEWHAAHPAIVHLPLGALLAVTLLMTISVARRIPEGFRWATLTLLVIGVIGAFLSSSSGEAAAEHTTIPEAAKELLHEHEESAELVRNLYAGVALAYAAVLIWRQKSAAARESRMHYLALGVLLLGALAIAPLMGAAAHRGGRLVHEFGVHAPIAAPAENP